MASVSKGWGRWSAAAVLAIGALAACSSGGSSGSGGHASGSGAVDAKVQSVYDSWVKANLPGVPISLVQQAKEEGSVVWYHTVDEAWTAELKEFNRIFSGIVHGTDLPVTDSAAFAKIRAEEATGKPKVDLWLSAGTALADQLQEAGLVSQYTVTSDSKYPAGLKKAGYYYPAYENASVAAWNTKKVKPEDAKQLSTFAGLRNADVWSRYNIGLIDVAVGPGDSIPAYYLQKVYGPDVWKGIAKFPNHIFTGANAAYNGLASGEVDVVFYSSSAPAQAAVHSGAPIAFTYPQPTLVTPPAQLIVKNAQHPAAAKLLDEFVLSKYGQTLANKSGQGSLYEGIPDARPLTKEPWYTPPSLDHTAKWSVADYAKTLPDLIKTWHSAFHIGG